MTTYYRFNEKGALEPCEEKDLESLGGLKWLSSDKVREYSEGAHEQDGWIAWRVRPPTHYGSDDLGTKGVFNPADGKTYDSRAEYYKAVKAKGYEIMGNDSPESFKPKPKKEIDWKQAVAETIYSTPGKRKKK